MIHFTDSVWVASASLVQSDLLGAGFAGAVVRLGPPWGAGLRGGRQRWIRHGGGWDWGEGPCGGGQEGILITPGPQSRPGAGDQQQSDSSSARKEEKVPDPTLAGA